MRILTIVAVLAAAAGCKTMQASETELRITDPSILEADVVDDHGKPMIQYEVGEDGDPHVRAIVGGFTPVTDVYVVMESPHRELSMRRMGGKLFVLPLADLVETGILHPQDEPLSFRVVAVDIEGDQTTTDPILLPIVAPAH